MISKFSVFYVGHIEFDHVGRDGTPADERRYPNERLVEAYQSAKELAQLMDELGFYCLWTAEHHFQREGYELFPNLILVNTWLATVTKHLRLGCAFNVLPAWHPLRLAEDFAVADIVTGGRVIFGIGRGYQWGTPGAPSGVPSLRDGVAQRAWLCGPPETVIQQLREIEERYPGLDQMMIHFPEGMPPGEFMDQLRAFARDVMPAFEATRAKTSGARG